MAAYNPATYRAPAWAGNLQGFDMTPARIAAGDESMLNSLFMNSPFAQYLPKTQHGEYMMGAGGEGMGFDSSMIPEGYQVGYHKLNNHGRAVLLDETGNPVGSWEGTVHDSLRSGDYAAIMAAMTAGYGIAGGFAGLGAGAGAAAGGETAALSAGQVGALSGGAEVGGAAGLGGAAGGGFSAGGASLYAPTGYAAGGSALAGTGSAGMAGAGAGAGAGLNTAALTRAGIGLAGSLLSSGAQGSAAQNASQIQQGAAAAGQAQLQPYATAGVGALTAQQDLAGLNGPEAQARAIAALQASPQFTSQQQLGENRILANASATGGLRGGNTQAALAQFSPALLAQVINEQYSRLGGLTNTGLSAAGGVSNLIQQGGAAQAGGALARGNQNASYIGAATNALGLYYGLNGGW